MVADSTVETLVSIDTSVETTLETEVSADRVAELDVPNEVAADVIPEVEMTLLTVTNELSSELFCVEASVARLAAEDTPLDVLVSAERFAETWLSSPETWLAAVDAPVEAAF